MAVEPGTLIHTTVRLCPKDETGRRAGRSDRATPEAISPTCACSIFRAQAATGGRVGN
jgi:hypothetical protein